MNFEVRVIDNLSSGRIENVALFEGRDGYRFFRMDITESDKLQSIFEGADWIFHLAALADIVPSVRSPLSYHRANVDGTVSALEAARQVGVKRFVYAASSTCYGIPDLYPTPETAPIRAQYPYALTKYVGEAYVMHWSQVYDLPAVSLRLFNVYGRRARTTGAYGLVFGVFLAQKLDGKPLTIVGDGEQTRDFTYVADVVGAMVAAAESDIKGEIFNVGSGNRYSVNRLASTIGGAVEYIPKRPGEPDCTWADTTKIRERLGWQPLVSFEEGVAIMLNHIEDWRDAPVWTRETIAEATADWFKYLGRSEGNCGEHTNAAGGGRRPRTGGQLRLADPVPPAGRDLKGG